MCTIQTQSPLRLQLCSGVCLSHPLHSAALNHIIRNHQRGKSVSPHHSISSVPLASPELICVTILFSTHTEYPHLISPLQDFMIYYSHSFNANFPGALPLKLFIFLFHTHPLQQLWSSMFCDEKPGFDCKNKNE